MKGFSYWPGKVVNPTKDLQRPGLKKPMQCIFFFGTKNYAWIPDDLIRPYEEHKDQFCKNKSSSFQDAVEEVEEYKKNPHKAEKAEAESTPKSTKPKTPTSKSKSSSDNGGKSKTQTPKQKNKTPTTKDDTPTARDLSKVKKEGSSNGSTPKSKISALKKKVFAQKSFVHSAKAKLAAAKKTAIGDKKRVYKGIDHRPTKKARVKPSEDEDDSQINGFVASSLPTKKTASGFLTKPAYVAPITPSLDVSSMSETLKQKQVKASCLNFGFLGLGIMGQGIVKNLLNSGHSVTVWNRTPSKCRDFVKAGAIKGQTPADVVSASDITFTCVSDPHAAKDMVFGNCGVLQEMRPGKGYVEMTTVDTETSVDISEAITMRGGRYIECQMQGSKVQAEEGTLILMAAGDKSLFDDCYSCIQSMSSNSFYLGSVVGSAAKMNLVLQVIHGTVVAGLAEGLALADRAGLRQNDLYEVIELSSLSCPAILDKAKSIIEGAFPTSMPLQHMQKDLRLSLQMGDQLEQPLPLTGTANEVFKHAKRLGYGEHDVSAVYIRARF
jgi:3-hydroxyisobutyrate dehydrogenase